MFFSGNHLTSRPGPDPSARLRLGREEASGHVRKAGLSRFIEDAARRRMFDRTVQGVQARQGYSPYLMTSSRSPH